MDNTRVIKYVAIGLALCFGWLGLHRHFLRTDHATFMTVLGVLGLFIGITVLITWVWAIVDVVRMFNVDDVEKLFPVREAFQDSE